MQTCTHLRLARTRENLIQMFSTYTEILFTTRRVAAFSLYPLCSQLPGDRSANRSCEHAPQHGLPVHALIALREQRDQYCKSENSCRGHLVR